MEVVLYPLFIKTITKMAKKITAVDESAELEGALATDASAELGTSSTTEEAEKADDTVDLKKEHVETDIPDNIKRLLQLVPQYKEVYISPRGGMYAIDTKPELRVGAILYQNPYWDNNLKQ